MACAWVEHPSSFDDFELVRLDTSFLPLGGGLCVSLLVLLVRDTVNPNHLYGPITKIGGGPAVVEPDYAEVGARY